MSPGAEPDGEPRVGFGEFLRGFGLGLALHVLFVGLPAGCRALGLGSDLLLAPLLVVGLFQLLYLTPLGLRYAWQHRKERLYGVVVLAVLTFLFNASGWLLVLSVREGGGLLP